MSQLRRNPKPRRNRKSKPTDAIARLRAIDDSKDMEIITTRVVTTLIQASGTITGLNAQILMNATSFSENQWVALYDEYRILGGTLHWAGLPTSLAAIPPAIAYFDNDNTPTIASNAAALEYNNSRLVPTTSSRCEQFSFNFERPKKGAHTSIDWYDTANNAPTSNGTVGVFTSNSFGSTVPVGNYYIEFLVEFRSRK